MCLMSQLLAKVTVTSCIFLHQMFNVSTLLPDNTFNLTMPLTNSVINVINETLRQFAPLSDISQGSVDTHQVWWDL